MSVVYIVRGDCGDYYCGCGGGHILGASLDKDCAEMIKRLADKAVVVYGTGQQHQAWPGGVEIEELPLNSYRGRSS